MAVESPQPLARKELWTPLFNTAVGGPPGFGHYRALDITVMELPIKRSARAILLDDQQRIMLIRRTKPGQPPYWTTPGGTVEITDKSVEAALYRELREELAADVRNVSEVLVHKTEINSQIVFQHFFVAYAISYDFAARSGPEFSQPDKGKYDLDFFSLTTGKLDEIDLQPSVIKEFIVSQKNKLIKH